MKRKSLVLLAAGILLGQTAPAQTVTITSATRPGLMTWTTPFTNASSTLLFSTNLNSGLWLPARHVFSTGSLASAALPTPRPPVAFYRVQTHDLSNVPSGLALIPEGPFQMGDNYAEGYSYEWPVHSVSVSSFYISRFETTHEQMRQVMQWAYDQGLIGVNATTVTNREGNPQPFLSFVAADGDRQATFLRFTNHVFYVEADKTNFPMSGITWYGALAYCNYKSDMDGLPRCVNFTNWSCDFTKNGYRLPTEAEWEKAARGGLTGQHYSWQSYGGSYAQHIDGSRAKYNCTRDPWYYTPYYWSTPVGYFDGNQLERGVPAGTNMVNGYGLYDMCGNVWEWCWDYWQGDWYAQPAATVDDPKGPNSNSSGRVIRGGSSGYDAWDLRVAYRHGHGWDPGYLNFPLGFRPVRNL